ncbi:MAG TPA: hypothetical protein VEY70_24080 [Metabacillus sp.]|nr:hypothetical protein [Metabacillus sp.]
MAIVRNTSNKKKKRKKEITFIQILRPASFIIIGLLIVHIYYLSTIDQLLPQIMKIYIGLIHFVQSIPTSILLIIGYSLLIFYMGYIVGKKTKS